MDWFLYDNGLRLERVNGSTLTAIVLIKDLKKYKYFQLVNKTSF